MPNSIRIEEYQNAIETLEKGEVWRNRELLAGYPAYIAGIKRNGELVMLVFIQDAASSQMTLYYLNLIKILCGLVEVSLLRALEYQEAVRDREYLEVFYRKAEVISFHKRTENRIICSAAD